MNSRVNAVLYYPNETTRPDDGILAQDNTSFSDNLTRITDVSDVKYAMKLRYGATSNCTADTHLGDAAIPASVTRERFDYDAAGRLIFTCCTADVPATST
jgi:hypothetical protein